MKPLLLAAALVMSPAVALADVSGEWTISSTAGATPITVHCTLLQKGQVLNGHCAPKDGTSGPLFRGTVKGNHASWGYDVSYRGQRSHVGFEADITAARAMTGVLTLSGKPSRFTAAKDSALPDRAG